MTGPLPSLGEIIRVLVIDDSPIARRRLRALIDEAPDMTVAGEGATGLEAVRLNHSLRPHIIAMDMDMPVMGGLEAARIIMQEYPTRIVMLTDGDRNNDPTLVETVQQAGALDICPKPTTSIRDETARNLIKLLRVMSHVGVVRRRRTLQDGETATLEMITGYPGMLRRPEIVLIVSSTGGPPALEAILSKLPAEFPLPVVIVQHISDEFQDNMMSWLDSVTHLKVKVAEEHERPAAGMYSKQWRDYKRWNYIGILLALGLVPLFVLAVWLGGSCARCAKVVALLFSVDMLVLAGIIVRHLTFRCPRCRQQFASNRLQVLFQRCSSCGLKLYEGQ